MAFRVKSSDKYTLEKSEPFRRPKVKKTDDDKPEQPQSKLTEVKKGGLSIRDSCNAKADHY